jgi:hypothetical protein
MFKNVLLGLVIVFYIPNLFAWDGYNYDTGSYIEVESYDHRGQGEGEVEYYDYSSGEYKSGYLDMYPGGSGDLTDYESGEVYQVDMD